VVHPGDGDELTLDPARRQILGVRNILGVEHVEVTNPDPSRRQASQIRPP
jgi:hypothetical protein